jgi:hypothetical protein
MTRLRFLQAERDTGTVFQNLDICLRRSFQQGCDARVLPCSRLGCKGYLNWLSLGSRACDPAAPLCQELFPVFRIPKSLRTT